MSTQACLRIFTFHVATTAAYNPSNYQIAQAYCLVRLKKYCILITEKRLVWTHDHKDKIRSKIIALAGHILAITNRRDRTRQASADRNNLNSPNSHNSLKMQPLKLFVKRLVGYTTTVVHLQINQQSHQMPIARHTKSRQSR